VKELTLDKAVSLSQAVEIVEKGAKDLQSSAAIYPQPHQIPISLSSTRELLLKRLRAKTQTKQKHFIILEEST